ncbi:MAG: dicarboxylate/amino acid:cation symporter, partial [Solobacterium sp.]|nr:dicarboxylate/amino acid:cation symporter [Solobacterium sp.]
ALQVVIIPMVFTSIVLAMIHISDTKKLGRISGKTIGYFMLTTICAIVIAALAGIVAYNAGAFTNSAVDLTQATGTAAKNPLMIVVNAIPNNITTALGNNSAVLAVVVSAAMVGICINHLQDKVTVLVKLCEEISAIITVFLDIVINHFGPIAIFCLIVRTCASYGVTHLQPAIAYVLLTVCILLLVLVTGYALFIKLSTGLNPIPFVKKIFKVALFGFSTSSSAATLPLNMKTTIEELGVNEEIASFVLPLGMTVNMDGTAIMQVIATIFIAGCAGYPMTFTSILTIGFLAIVASVGTPAAPGAGAVILFTILSGVGFNNELALMTYTLILAINRPIEMLVTSLNVVGDSACAIAVAKSEGALDVEAYEKL